MKLVENQLKSCLLPTCDLALEIECLHMPQKLLMSLHRKDLNSRMPQGTSRPLAHPSSSKTHC
uniref:WRKY transcription factor n=1 Tax=Aquilaria malaccensis TaxID=223753 RepID=A0A4Y6GN52_9ROSI|nr:WRKY transcription factor [Aquilaria malaccensis]